MAAVAAVLSAMTLVVLDAGMVNVALPSIALAFGVSPATAILVVTAYQAGLVVALLPLGALGERHGHRRVFALSLAVFAAASMAALLAPGLSWLIVARFIQGLGGAGIMALGVALLRLTVSDARLGRAIGWNALTVALSSAAAPSLAALMLVAGDWRGLFAATLPIALFALSASRSLPSTPRVGARPDGRSIILSAVVFASLIAAAQMAISVPSLAALPLVIALIALVLLIRRERPKAAPLIPLDLLKAASFRRSVVASICCFAAQSAGLVALPFLLQHRLGQGPLQAGLHLTAWPLSVAVAAALSGWLADRAPSAWLCGLGCATLAGGLAICAIAPLPLAVLPGLALAGLGFGLFQTPNNRNLFLAAPAHRSGAAGGIQGLARICGQAAGALLMATLFGRLGVDAALPLGLAAACALAATAAAVSVLKAEPGPPIRR